ncbi:DUF2130 domain-containing protein [Flavitalea antarctica]
MATEIKCPKCGNSFPMEDSIRKEVQHEFQAKWIEAQKKKDEEYRKKENDIRLQLEATQKELADQEIITRQKIEQATSLKEEEIRKRILQENDNQIRVLQEKITDSENQVRTLKVKELEVLRLESRMEELQRHHENDKEKYLLENKKKIQEEILLQERERFELVKKEWEVQMEQQKKLIEEMKRKADQGSTQLQGEVLELLLEDLLANAFPFDKVTEVAKGKRGGDCLLIVRNRFGAECGKILFESKRAATWGKEWVDKLKQDMVRAGADIGVLVSQVMPDKLEDRYEFRDGVWICGFSDTKLLTASLREGLLRIHSIAKAQDGKEDKIQLLYDYMTSQEFSTKWKSIREVFRNMQQSMQKEKEVMEKLWKNREKQLDRAMLNSDHIIGSIEGIAGKESIDMELLSDLDQNLLGTDE